MRGLVAGLIIGFQVLGVLAAASMVGKPREPLTSGVFTWMVLLSFVLSTGVYWLWAS